MSNWMWVAAWTALLIAAATLIWVRFGNSRRLLVLAGLWLATAVTLSLGQSTASLLAAAICLLAITVLAWRLPLLPPAKWLFIGGATLAAITTVAQLAASAAGWGIGLLAGETAVFIAILVTISQQLQQAQRETAVATASHHASTQRFHTLIESVPSGILFVSPQGIITMANQEAAQIFHTTPTNLIDLTIEDLIPSRYHSIHQLHRQKFMQEMRTRPMGLDMHLIGRRRDGEEFDIEVGLGVITNGTDHDIICFIRDISQRKAIEKQRDRQARDLARSNRELEQFAYIVSHDLRAPLRALSTYGQFLQEDYATKLDDEGLTYVQGIIENAQHMDRLVQDLLEYARIGRVGIPKTTVDMQELLQRIVINMQLDVDVTITIPPNLPQVQGYEIRLEQIFINLLQNAVKFRHHDKHAVINIHWADRGRAWTFAVQDNGIGIDPRHNEKIFEIFQRLHSEDEFDGTGIGLAIVKKAVEEHGGQIWVESQKGEGALFTFTLPK